MSGPPFDRYPVAPSTIRANADRVANAKQPLIAVKDAMDAPRQRAADAVDGELDGQIAGPTDPAQRDALETARGADLCSGAVELYADHVELFNLGVDDLNRRWNSALERDFGVAMGDDPKEHDADVADARSQYAEELRKEYAKLERELDDGARDVARVLNAGPADGVELLKSYRTGVMLQLWLARLTAGGGTPSLEEIQNDYQVGDDPNGMVYLPGVGHVTASEAWMLGNLGLLALWDMKSMRDKAFSTADDRFTPEDRNDNHNDAFRHAYWNALMTRRFGEDWTKNYANAHEGIPGNQAVREAMDLYNNEVGRRIAMENPDVSDEELAELIEEAVRNGEMVIVGPDGTLQWSNTIEEGGNTGNANDTDEGDQEGNPDNDPESSADPDSHNDHGTGS